MTQTIIGVFPSLDQANAAMNAFASDGLADKQHMRLSPNENVSGYGYDGETTENGTVGAPAYPDAQAGNEPHSGVLASIERFFRHLFGGDDRPDSAAHYHEAVIRGSTLLAIDVEDAAQISTIEAELERAGAVNIEAQVARWQTDGYIGQARKTVANPNIEAGLTSGGTPFEQVPAHDTDPVKTPKL